MAGMLHDLCIACTGDVRLGDESRPKAMQGDRLELGAADACRDGALPASARTALVKSGRAQRRLAGWLQVLILGNCGYWKIGAEAQWRCPAATLGKGRQMRRRRRLLEDTPKRPDAPQARPRSNWR